MPNHVVQQGEPLAQLIAVVANTVGVPVDLTGRGQEDLRNVLASLKAANKQLEFWRAAIRDIIEHVAEQNWPEEVKGYIYAAILRARVNTDLAMQQPIQKIEVKT